MYEAQDFSHLLGIAGFSDKALQTHFSLYQGYVTNVNKLSESLARMLSEDKAGTPEYAELKRRFGWEFNGMRLHEYYFASLKKDSVLPERQSALYKKIETDFGSFANWEKDFRATASMRGIGWAILCHDRSGGRLYNVWINEHDVGHLASAEIILPLDVFEHAFIIDHGPKRADYIEAFMNAVNWDTVEKRFAV